MSSVWQDAAQMPVDSIVDKMKLFNKEEVLAIRTNLETTFKEAQNNNSIFKNKPG